MPCRLSIRLLKRAFRGVALGCFGCFLTSFATASPAPPEGETMVRNFLREEAVRLDGKFLEGITNRQAWEAARPGWRQQYLEMLGIWPLPERTPVNPQVTGTLDRSEGFHVEKLHFQSRPHLYVT